MIPGIGLSLLVATGLLSAVGFVFGALFRLTMGESRNDSLGFSNALVGGMRAWSSDDGGNGRSTGMAEEDEAERLAKLLREADELIAQAAQERDLLPEKGPATDRVRVRVGPGRSRRPG